MASVLSNVWLRIFSTCGVFVMVVFVAVIYAGSRASGQTDEVLKNGNILLSNWFIKSTVLEKEGGQEISMGQFTPENWYPAKVPTTVLNALVNAGVYPDPRLDVNNYKIPDISDRFNAEYDLAKYSYLPNHVNPWKAPYWFRTEFTVPDSERGREVWLNFNGINYRAEVWLNGKMIADSSQVVGMFKRYKFNVTDVIKEAGRNFLAVKIYPVDYAGTPGTQFEVFGPPRTHSTELFKNETLKISGGWDCALPVRDRNMGIYKRVYISFTGKVEIANPYVVTILPLPDTSLAHLTISATLSNASNERETGLLVGKIDLLTEVNMGNYVKHYPGEMKSIRFEKEVGVPAKGEVEVIFSYRDFPQLTIKDPHLWWPNGYGQQYLHNLELSFVVNGKVSSTKNTMFGIREVTSNLHELNGDYGRVFYVNGRRIFCRGGWIQPDMLLDNSKQNVYDQVRLIANANLNLISSEDMPAPSGYLMDAMDKYGIMWWEVFYQCWMTVPGTNTAYYPLDHFLAIESSRDIILRNRNHPSLIAWFAGNESVPGPDLYLALKEQLAVLDTTRPFIPSTAIWWDWEKLTPYIKDDLPTGVTDVGPPGYTWHPQSYFFDLIDTGKGQMFRDELGVPSIPPFNDVRKFIFNLHPDTSNPYFPLDSVWAEHGAWDANGYNYRAYDTAIRKYYGFRTKSAADYVRIAQVVNADSYRAMFEAANSRMWDITSGIMLWKLNSSYPDITWLLYDWFLNPNAAYYYTKKACEPLHIQLNANDFAVSVINTYDRQIKDLTVKATVYDFNAKRRWSRKEEINMGPDRYEEVFKVPVLSKITPVYFVKLQLVKRTGEVLSSNLYWESSETTPDFSALSSLERVKPNLAYKVKETGREYLVVVTLRNPTGKISFMNRLAIVKRSDNQEVVPTFWTDNYITLLPGEERTIEARFARENLGRSAFNVVLDDNR